MTDVLLYKSTDRPDFLLPVIREWKAESKDFGLDENEDIFLNELQKDLNGNFSLLLLADKEKVVGFMGLRYEQSPIGANRIANEHYWFVLPEYRTIGSLKLLTAAKGLAKQNGCSHMVITASNLASGLHDKVCAFLEKIRMKKFETSYILKLEE